MDAFISDQMPWNGAAVEAQLAALAPLIEYYEREMGELPGRLMIATSFLNDAQQMPGWDLQAPEIRQAVEQAHALVLSVLGRLLAAQQQRDQDNGLLDELFSKS